MRNYVNDASQDSEDQQSSSAGHDYDCADNNLQNHALMLSVLSSHDIIDHGRFPHLLIRVFHVFRFYL